MYSLQDSKCHNSPNHIHLMTHWPWLSWLAYADCPHCVWQAADAAVKFKKLNPRRTREDLVPTGNSEPEEEEQESPQDAEPVTGIQEWMPKTFRLFFRYITYIIPYLLIVHCLNACIASNHIELFDQNSLFKPETNVSYNAALGYFPNLSQRRMVCFNFLTHVKL